MQKNDMRNCLEHMKYVYFITHFQNNKKEKKERYPGFLAVSFSVVALRRGAETFTCLESCSPPTLGPCTKKARWEARRGRWSSAVKPEARKAVGARPRRGL